MHEWTSSGGITQIKSPLCWCSFLCSPGLSNIEHRFAATGFNTGNLLIGDATHALLTLIYATMEADYVRKVITPALT